MKKVKSAVIYARVSNMGEVRHSLANQQSICREYCKREGLEVIKIFSENEAPWPHQRNGLSHVLEYCRKNKPVALIVADTTRISRSKKYLKYFSDKLSKFGTIIHSITKAN
jgi:DNA invertase Pin-like site-specific DNA recombinase